jgi:hypothetical protein
MGFYVHRQLVFVAKKGLQLSWFSRDTVARNDRSAISKWYKHVATPWFQSRWQKPHVSTITSLNTAAEGAKSR